MIYRRAMSAAWFRRGTLGIHRQ